MYSIAKNHSPPAEEEDHFPSVKNVCRIGKVVRRNP